MICLKHWNNSTVFKICYHRLMKIFTKLRWRFSRFNRKRELRFAKEYIKRNKISSCLVVGATPKFSEHKFVNLIESYLPLICDKVVFRGIEPTGGLWPNWIQADGKELPFADKEFDFVFSNAVIEHVDGEEAQRQFLLEHSRVGKYWIATIPNRQFPIESHTGRLFNHMTKKWTHESFTRLLSKKDLKRISPKVRRIIKN